MNIKELKEALPYLIKSETPALVIGAHGTGKTQSFIQYADDTKAKLMILNLGSQDVGDLIGLADFKTDKEGNKVATKFMMPNWALDILEFCKANPNKNAILFLDEINRARRDVLQAVFSLMTEKRLHDVYFPSNFYVCGAMNPNTGDYLVTDINDKALMDRFCHIKFQPSAKEFMDYARTQEFDSAILSFLAEQPKLLSSELESFEITREPSKRSWFKVNEIKKLNPPKGLLLEMTTGLVGLAASTAMMKALEEGDKPIHAEEVLEDYSKVQKRVKSYSKSGKRIDLLKFTVDSLVEHTKKLGEKVLEDNASNNLIKFLEDIPKELAFDALRALYWVDAARPTVEKAEDLLTRIAEIRKKSKKSEDNK